MNLIDRYVDEVGRHLPEKDRSDIEAEIRSMVEDMLEERGHQPKSADDKSIAATLEDLGDPKLLAHPINKIQRILCKRHREGNNRNDRKGRGEHTLEDRQV